MNNIPEGGQKQQPQLQVQPPKKLRFITNQGAPHPKRRRITAACLTCRKRKIACSGEQPICQTCIQNKLDCAGYTKDAKSSNSPSKSRLNQSSNDGRKESNASPEPSSRGHGETNVTDKDVRMASSDSPRRSDATSTNRYSDDSPRPNEALFSRPRDRMPYFRWLGPTAIMPGFKQMVVKVKRHGTGAPSSTDDNITQSPTMIGGIPNSFPNPPSVFSSSTSHINDSDMRTSLALPFYDTSSMPPSELITHLCETFFVHLGCNFPFLQKPRFLKDLETKQVDAILVDAMCAMAARFSTHPLLVEQTGENGVRLGPSDYGYAFAQRAKNALIDAYAVPGVAAIQAALLLAYNEFGESRDSGLWMYLGIAIRMVQDLGLQKREGLRYEGREGPAPCTVNTTKSAERPSVPHVSPLCVSTEAEEIVAIERERIDTFWAVFFLDKVVSSGTGRRSTLLDDDIELSFPSLDSSESEGFPSPFPALIRIVHLYGRVADLLNSIKSPTEQSPDTPKRLAEMEQQVTQFYQGLSSRLHFEAMNFHHYVKTGEGTNFILLHLWFHTLIILLHQPTLLKTFEGRTLQLFPNSQQLSLSSAKTIADMLSYSQLIDSKACLGNPFTTQPIYIAACAFLKETAERSSTSTDSSHSTSRDTSQNVSRAVSPNRGFGATSSQGTISGTAHDFTTKQSISSKPIASGKVLDKAATKHILLAQAASQHYQLCYHALESLETYWSGAKYILTVLDQKFKGVGDPLLYTAEEGESSLEQPRPEPVFSSPGWRRKISWAPSLRNHAAMRAPFLSSGRPMAGSSKSDHAQGIYPRWRPSGVCYWFKLIRSSDRLDPDRNDELTKYQCRLAFSRQRS